MARIIFQAIDDKKNYYEDNDEGYFLKTHVQYPAKITRRSQSFIIFT